MHNQDTLIADRYRLITLLGRGGFSEVWLAEDMLTGVKVAVKIYAPGVGLDDAGISLFTKELSLVFDINHTNLLRPTHYDYWQRMPFLILPYCQNGSIFKYLTSDNRMPEIEVWKLLHDVSAGLAYLHAKNPPIIHQDIKPDNILISDEGHYMITDFGISARVRSTLSKVQSEMSGGTLAYMGPERFGQTPQPIMASDIWSLGAMMYEMITGFPPYNNHGGMLQKNGADIPLIDADYSQLLKNIIYQCLSLNTWDRPTASEIERYTNDYLMGTLSDKDNNSLSSSMEEPTQEKKVIKGNEPNTSKYKKYGIFAGFLLSVIIALCLIFGGEDKEVENFGEQNVSEINYDNICLEYLNEGERLMESVDSLISPYIQFDSSNGFYLEDTLIKAHELYSEAHLLIKDKKVSESFQLDVDLDIKKKKIENVLDTLSATFDKQIVNFGQGIEEWKHYADTFRLRKETIYIFKLKNE